MAESSLMMRRISESASMARMESSIPVPASRQGFPHERTSDMRASAFQSIHTHARTTLPAPLGRIVAAEDITMTAVTTATDIEALETRLKATWEDGNYDYFSRFMESSAVEFLDRLAVKPDASLLDVACGSGQLGLSAARRGVKVTGVDIAANSILAARGRAAAEGIDARFDE